MDEILKNSLLPPAIHQQIRELTLYTTDRSHIYRPIIRFLYGQRKEARFGVESAEIATFIREFYPELGEYTVADCEEDLLRLHEWQAVRVEQQRGRVATIPEFQKRRLKAQIGPLAFAVEGALVAIQRERGLQGSLNASSLDQIRAWLRSIEMALAPGVPREPQARGAVADDWRRACVEFQSMGDRAASFYEPFFQTRTLDLTDPEKFLVHKEKLVAYIRDFGDRLVNDAAVVYAILQRWEREGIRARLVEVVADAAVEQAAVGTAVAALTSDAVREISPEAARSSAEGQYEAFREWFGPAGTQETLAAAAMHAIHVIVGFARRLANEGRVPAARQREWQRLAALFHRCKDVAEAHALAGVALGLAQPRHLRDEGGRFRELDPVWEQKPFTVYLRRRDGSQRNRQRRRASVIEDQTAARARIEEEIRAKVELEKRLWRQLIASGSVDARGQLVLADPQTRDLLLDVVGRCLSSSDGTAEGPDGRTVQLVTPEPGSSYGSVVSSDGTFLMPAYRLVVASPEVLYGGA